MLTAALNFAHKKIDFDGMHDKIPKGTPLSTITTQLVNVAFNGTYLGLKVEIPSENSELEDSATTSMAWTIAIIGIVLLVFFITWPNLVSLVQHIRGKKTSSPPTLDQLIKQKVNQDLRNSNLSSFRNSSNDSHHQVLPSTLEETKDSEDMNHKLLVDGRKIAKQGINYSVSSMSSEIRATRLTLQ